MRNPRRYSGRAGFTLIELLVVITIIVLLLALLTPALDKAVYQAQLAVCAAHLDAIASGVTMYAIQNDRRYPYRAANAATQNGPHQRLTNPNAGNGDWSNGFDDRPYLSGFVPLQALVDPLCQTIDLSIEASDTDSSVASSIALWYGFRYYDAGGGEGMDKIGDRVAWQGANLFNRQIEWASSLLAADRDMLGAVFGDGNSSHPDSLRKSHPDVLFNEHNNPGTLPMGLNASGKSVWSRWFLPGPDFRGLVDLNFAFVDGGVTRIGNLPWDDEQRVTSVPAFSTGAGGGRWFVIVPK